MIPRIQPLRVLLLGVFCWNLVLTHCSEDYNYRVEFNSSDGSFDNDSWLFENFTWAVEPPIPCEQSDYICWGIFSKQYHIAPARYEEVVDEPMPVPMPVKVIDGGCPCEHNDHFCWWVYYEQYPQFDPLGCFELWNVTVRNEVVSLDNMTATWKLEYAASEGDPGLWLGPLNSSSSGMNHLGNDLNPLIFNETNLEMMERFSAPEDEQMYGDFGFIKTPYNTEHHGIELRDTITFTEPNPNATSPGVPLEWDRGFPVPPPKKLYKLPVRQPGEDRVLKPMPYALPLALPNVRVEEVQPIDRVPLVTENRSRVKKRRRKKTTTATTTTTTTTAAPPSRKSRKRHRKRKGATKKTSRNTAKRRQKRVRRRRTTVRVRFG